jgi:predicted RNA-binding Zn-ribbon protein involved in translation (DUF1610 family)
MKYQHVKRIFNNPFYVNLKKHYCPNCGRLMHKIKLSRIINSQSSEAGNFDFHNVDNYMVGNVKFIWTEFKCSKCENQLTIDSMRRINKKGNEYKKGDVVKISKIIPYIVITLSRPCPFPRLGKCHFLHKNRLQKAYCSHHPGRERLIKLINSSLTPTVDWLR